MYDVHSFVDTASNAIFVLQTICSMVQWELSYISTRSSIWVSQRAQRCLIRLDTTSWCPSDMYIKLHLCRVLEASGSILVDIERYGICCIRS